MENNYPTIGSAADPDVIVNRLAGYYFRDEPPESRRWAPEGRKLKIYPGGKIYEFENGAAFGTLSWPVDGDRKYYQKGDIIFLDELTPAEWAQVVPNWQYEDKNAMEALLGVLLILAGVSNIFPERYKVGWKVEDVEWNPITQQGAAILRPQYKAGEDQPWIVLPYRLRFTTLTLNRYFAEVQFHLNHRWWMKKVETGIEWTVDFGRLIWSGGSASAAKWVSTKGAGKLLVRILRNKKIRRKFAFRLFKMLNDKLAQALLAAAKKSIVVFIKEVESAKELQQFRSDELSEAQWQRIFAKAIESFAKNFVEQVFDLILTKSHMRSVGVLFRKNLTVKRLAKSILLEFIIEVHIDFCSKELAAFMVRMSLNSKPDAEKEMKKVMTNLIEDRAAAAKGHLVDRYVTKYTNDAVKKYREQLRLRLEDAGIRMIDSLFKRIKSAHE